MIEYRYPDRLSLCLLIWHILYASHVANLMGAIYLDLLYTYSIAYDILLVKHYVSLLYTITYPILFSIS